MTVQFSDGTRRPRARPTATKRVIAYQIAMLAECGTERQVEKRPNLTTSRNAERQKGLLPSASDGHSRHEWRSSPSRIENNRGCPRENGRSLARPTQNPTHGEHRGRPQEVALCDPQRELSFLRRAVLEFAWRATRRGVRLCVWSLLPRSNLPLPASRLPRNRN